MILRINTDSRYRQAMAVIEAYLIQDLLLNDLRSLIAQASQRVATTINSEITRLYRAIGKRITN